MAPKPRSSKLESKPAPLDPNIVRLAILTAILDPKGVKRDLSYGRLPNSVSVALDLIKKIDSFLNGRQEAPGFRLFRLDWPEDDPTAKPDPLLGFDLPRISEHLSRKRAIEEWRLGEGERFSLLQATKQGWCQHGSEKWLQKLLQRNSYPFYCSDGQLCITRAAYEKLLAVDLTRRRKLDIERKRKNRSKKKNLSRRKEPNNRKI